MKKKFSFVIPVFNTGKYLTECVKSIISSCGEGVDFEILLVDDCSSDDLTLRMLNDLKLMGGVRVFSLEKNGGPSVARNLGVNNSFYDWIIFVDSDDVLSIDSIDIRVDFMVRHPDALWMVGDYDEMRSCSEIVHADYYSVVPVVGDKIGEIYYLINSPTQYLVSWGTPPSVGATMIKKELFKKIGGFNEALRYGEDWYFSLLVGLHASLYWINKPIVHVRRNHESMMTNNLMIGGHISLASKYAYNDVRLIAFRKKIAWRVASDERWSSSSYLKANKKFLSLLSAFRSIIWSLSDRRSYMQFLFVLKKFVSK